jgi:hypothetical protein
MSGRTCRFARPLAVRETDLDKSCFPVHCRFTPEEILCVGFYLDQCPHRVAVDADDEWGPRGFRVLYPVTARAEKWKKFGLAIVAVYDPDLGVGPVEPASRV